MDAGCGDGFGSFLLAENGYHVTGVDIAEAMIERAMHKRVHTNIKFQKASFDGAATKESVDGCSDGH
nr:class I SAM-dependent methyltransferase [Bacillus sp. m3-13]